MKKLMMILGLVLAVNSFANAQTVIELKTNDSMCISGKGRGQDAAINPYLGERSIAVIENIGRNSFDVRIQEGRKLIDIIEVDGNEQKEFVLEKDYVLYMDADSRSTGKISFKKYDQPVIEN